MKTNFAISNNSQISIKQTYQRAKPFPHLVVDDFFDPAVLRIVEESLPAVDHLQWVNYIHYTEHKYGFSTFENFPEPLKNIVQLCHSSNFLAYLESITGLMGLKPDPTLSGGGIHVMQDGGFLKVHTDFSHHPHHAEWRRVLNVIVFLNSDWKVEYGGDLQFWNKEPLSCSTRIFPHFNRMVIFETNEDTLHGVPEPIKCPKDRARKTLALYYYIDNKHVEVEKSRSTKYFATGKMSKEKVGLENMGLRIFQQIRLVCKSPGFEKSVSRILKRFFN